MTPEQVQVEVDRIVADGNADPEASHGDEDDLKDKVLAAIRDGSKDAAELARVVLTIDDHDLTRWYA